MTTGGGISALMGLSMVLAQTLSVPLVSADLSRLVCDLNRPLDAPDLHRQDCEGVKMSFNIGLGEESLKKREKFIEFFTRLPKSAFKKPSLVI